MRAGVVWLVMALTACSAEPRAVTYFEAHPEEAARVMSACETGSHRGVECQNAEAAMVAARREARMKRYKKAFE